MFYNMATTITTSSSSSSLSPTTLTAATQTGGIVKKPGPPVPPRPTASLIATTLRTTTSINSQRNISNNNHHHNYTNHTPAALTSFQAKQTTPTTTTHENKINAIRNTIEIQQHHKNINNNINNNNVQPPMIQKKPIVNRQNSAGGGGGGRTVIYKSPSINLQQRQDNINNKQQQQQQQLGIVQPTVRTSIAPKPPLKLRKAPDVPKPTTTTTTNTMSNITRTDNQMNNNSTSSCYKHMKNVTPVSVVAANGVNLNRHNSMGCAGTPKPAVGLKETRLSLGRVDTDKYGKISVDQLQLSSQPLPKPRKIVQMPVATMDLMEQKTSTSTTSAMANIFRRSKTTLDNITNRGHVTTVNTGTTNSPNRFGRTVEFKNNLKNAAERLFAEMMVSQSHKQVTESHPTIITKHERAIQHQPQQQQQQQPIIVTVAVNSTPLASNQVNVSQNNCTRISINGQENGVRNGQIGSLVNSPEKKTAFHEILISEIAAMRAKSSSMENLQTKKDAMFNGCSTPTMARDFKANMKSSSTNTHLHCNNSEDEYEEEHEHEEDNCEDDDDDDVDADNVEDTEGDEDCLRKTLKLGTKSATRKRCPSGCSSDSSPYGTERSARIRTSDWIEVQDNGKEVTLTSCHISLEDSGLEDEERMDDVSSSGVGDSWDSVKESQNEQRCLNIKR